VRVSLFKMTFSHASVLCVVAMLAMAAAAAPVPMHDGAVLGAHRAATLGWVREGRTRPHTVLDFMFAMKNRNVDMLEATLMAVSNPDSQYVVGLGGSNPLTVHL